MTSSLIAVIDNDRDFRMTMARALEEEGYAIITSAWEPAALQALPNAAPQLILLNIHDGAAPDWQLVAELQADPAIHRTPILVCCQDTKQTQRAMLALLEHIGLVQASSYNLEEVTLKAKQLLDVSAARNTGAPRVRSVGL